MKKGDELVQPVCATSMEEPDEITKIHHLSGHPGVQRTCYFVWLTNPLISTSAVWDVVKICQTCQSIDPASVKWRKENPLWQPTFPHTHRLWTLQIRSLATIATPRLYKYHPPTRVSVLQMRAARGDIHR